VRGRGSVGMAFVVPEAELAVRASRSRGPGGQHVNKAATRIEVVWDVWASPSLTEAQRTRLRERLAARLDSRGRLRVVADGSRSQRRNLEDATTRLRALVQAALRVPKARRPTRPTRAAVERRLDTKRRRAARKQERRRPDPDA
jgi:ribosome-associated protein